MLLDGAADLRLSLLQIAQVLEPVGQLAQELVVHGAVELLAVAGDEGDGGPLVQQSDHIVDLLHRAVQLPGEGL